MNRKIITVVSLTISFLFGTLNSTSFADDIARMAQQATEARDAIARQQATTATLRDKFEAAATKAAEKEAAMKAAEGQLAQASGTSGRGNGLKAQAEALLKAAKINLGARTVAAAKTDVDTKQTALFAVLGNPASPTFAADKRNATQALVAAKAELTAVREAQQKVNEAEAAVNVMSTEFSDGILTAAEAATKAQKARVEFSKAKTAADKAEAALEKAEQKIEQLLNDNALLLGSTTLFARIGNRLQKDAPAATSSTIDPGIQARVADLVAKAEQRNCDTNLQVLIQDLQRAASNGQPVDPATLSAAESQVMFASFK